MTGKSVAVFRLIHAANRAIFNTEDNIDNWSKVAAINDKQLLALTDDYLLMTALEIPFNSVNGNDTLVNVNILNTGRRRVVWYDVRHDYSDAIYKTQEGIVTQQS